MIIVHYLNELIERLVVADQLDSDWGGFVLHKYAVYEICRGRERARETETDRQTDREILFMWLLPLTNSKNIC